jgi:hypothetical protein
VSAGWIAALAMNVKHQVFVSSTYEDFKDERSKIIRVCLEHGPHSWWLAFHIRAFHGTLAKGKGR